MGSAFSARPWLLVNVESGSAYFAAPQAGPSKKKPPQKLKPLKWKNPNFIIRSSEN
jgi:hypothetical protein